MMITLNLALRNLLRNRRRSIATLLAMAIGCTAILLFGGFSGNINCEMHTRIRSISSGFVGGATSTTAGKLSLTAEYQYNGFGLNQTRSSASAFALAAQVAYLREALRRQELAPQQAFLVYVSHANLIVKDLNLTAYVRVNLEDHSRLAWIELRRHWASFDLAFQLQQNIG